MRRYTKVPFSEMTEKDFYGVYAGLSKELGKCWRHSKPLC